MRNLLLKSNAKINICLNVLGKKDDGYHELDMIMVPIEMHDSMLLTKLGAKVDNYVTIDDFSLGETQYNLATFAIETMQKEFGFDQKFRVNIHKVLPIQAGMGGGSSNAAFTMKGINKMLKLNASDERLIEIGKKLGADIPFFIKNVPSRCQGIGEILTPITIKNNYWVIIAKPSKGCSTKEVFKICDSTEIKTCNVENVIKALENGDDDLLADSISNSLEDAAIQLVPEIQTIKDELKSRGLKIVLMSGSGSAVFGLSTDKKLIKKIALELEDTYQVAVTKVMK